MPKGNDRTHSSHDEVRGWFAGRLPDEWFEGPPEISADRDEILVTGTLAPPALGDDETPETREAAIAARIGGFREDTRATRMRIADEAMQRFGRRISWGVRCDGRKVTFTTLSMPAMTRLRLAERQVLDTLVDAGVARSRSHALAWCVRLVAEHEDEWLRDLRDALTKVERVRAEGPN